MDCVQCGIQRTRNMIFDAFIDMMFERGYDALTIQDIIDQANVGRSTFYSHFADSRFFLPFLYYSRTE